MQMLHSSGSCCTIRLMLVTPADVHASKLIDVSIGLLNSVRPPANVASTGNEALVSTGLLEITVLLMLPNPGMLVSAG